MADATPYPSNVFVSGITGTVNHVAVTLNNISYSHSQDVDALLVGPGGQTLILVANLGPNSGAGAAVSNATVTFSDAGVLPPSAMATSWSALSTVKPVNYGGFNEVWGPPAPSGPYGDPGTAGTAATLASRFNGINGTGTWSLYVITTASGDGTGAIAGGWCATITTAADTAASTSTLVSDNNPSFTTAPGNQVTFTVTVHKSADNSPIGEGTVAFTDNGTPIAGCAAVAVAVGHATCATAFAGQGTHPMAASYRGSANFGASNASLSQVVNNHSTVVGNTFCNTGSIALNNPPNTVADATPYPSNISVSGRPGNLLHLSVTLNNVSYSHSQDIDALLVGPNGQTLILVANLGPNSGLSAAASNSTLTLDDNGILPPSGQTTPWGSNSTFKAVNYGGFNEVWGPPAPPGPYGDPGPGGGGNGALASTFNGTSPNGTWSLYDITTAPGDGTGAIAGGWCLNVHSAPAITTTASAAVPAGGTISDTAALTGGVAPTGTITFTLFGPDNAACTGTPIFTSTKSIAGGGSYTSDTFTPTAPGTYRWLAAYSGDANNSQAGPTACSDQAESVVVSVATPTVVTHTSAPVTVGGAVSDTATLAAGVSPTGTVTFQLFGPNDATCSGTAIFTSTKSVVGNGEYSSDPFTPTAPGTYRFVVNYGGDTNNAAATSACGAANESVVVSQSAPTLVTVASPTLAAGGAISDTAHLSGGVGATGAITFSLFGPDNATCTGTEAFTSTVSANAGNGNYRSALFTTVAAGTYRWVAAYSGDANNTAVITACNDANESVIVTKAAPTIATQASAAVTIGGAISDTATMSGATGATGTIVFNVFGPNNATCTATPAFTATDAVAGNGNYLSGSFTPTAPGTYRWVAAYSGDANNSQAGPTACGDAAESVVVSTATPTVVTHASGAVTVGGTISDTATLAGGVSPTGSVTFQLFGPNDATCSGTAIFTSTKSVVGNGDYSSDPFTPTAPGAYRFVASYGGDTTNAAATSACGAANESVAVTQSLNGFTPLVPVRICDTRAAGVGVVANQCDTNGHSALSTSGVLTVTVAGVSGVPANATAVVLHMTATGTNAASYLTVWPTGQSRPTVANVNWAPGQTAPNLVQMGVGAGGTVSVFNYAGSVDVIVDLDGYVSPGAGGLFVPTAPIRVCDTRLGQPVNQCNHGGTASGTMALAQTRVVNVVSGFGLPAATNAVVVNVTATATSSASYLTVWPDGPGRPVAASLNWAGGQTISNRVIVGVSPAGNIDLYNAYGNADVVIDLGGYFTTSGPGSGYYPVPPTRICDTRPAGPGVAVNACNTHGVGTVGGGQTLALSGYKNPSVTAFVTNVTVTNSAAIGYLTVYSASSARPSAPDYIWAAHQTIGNLVVADLGSNGAFNLFNGSVASTDVVIDIDGYYSTTPPSAAANGALPLVSARRLK